MYLNPDKNTDKDHFPQASGADITNSVKAESRLLTTPSAHKNIIPPKPIILVLFSQLFLSFGVIDGYRPLRNILSDFKSNTKQAH
jgi:hypothetical protein